MEYGVDSTDDGWGWTAFLALQDKEKYHPYTMATVLTDEKDPCDADKVKMRARDFVAHGYHHGASRDTIQSEEIHFPADVRHREKYCDIHYASEDNKVIEWLEGQMGKRGPRYRERHHQNHSRDEEEHRQRRGHHSRKEHHHDRDHYWWFYEADKDVNKLYDEIIKKGCECAGNAEKAAAEMLSSVFEDVDLAKWKDLFTQHWLPTMHEPYNKNYVMKKRDDFIRDCRVTVENFLIGLDQMVQDQNKMKGPMAKQFEGLLKDAKDFLGQQLKGLEDKVNVHVPSTVHPTIMPENARQMKTDIGRALRDYAIINQYVKNMVYFSRGFCFYRYDFT